MGARAVAPRAARRQRAALPFDREVNKATDLSLTPVFSFSTRCTSSCASFRDVGLLDGDDLAVVPHQLITPVAPSHRIIVKNPHVCVHYVWSGVNAAE
jgi:hypothetical protein